MNVFFHRAFTAIAIVAGTASIAHSQLIFDTGTPAKMFNLGVRAGFNTSNLTNNFAEKVSDVKWMHNSWRQGFTGGVVFDINLRNFFSLQPGAFISTRANSYNLVSNTGNQLVTYHGRMATNYLQIPVLASFRLGVVELAQLQLDFGPYFAWAWGGENKYTLYRSDVTGDVPGQPVVNEYKDQKSPYLGNGGIAERYDWGIKTGVGIVALEHFYIGAHYMYGMRNVLQPITESKIHVKGHNKMWTFTVGYNF